MATGVSLCVPVASVSLRLCLWPSVSLCDCAYVCIVYFSKCFGLCAVVCVALLFSVCLMVYGLKYVSYTLCVSLCVPLG